MLLTACVPETEAPSVTEEVTIVNEVTVEQQGGSTPLVWLDAHGEQVTLGPELVALDTEGVVWPLDWRTGEVDLPGMEVYGYANENCTDLLVYEQLPLEPFTITDISLGTFRIEPHGLYFAPATMLAEPLYVQSRWVSGDCQGIDDSTLWFVGYRASDLEYRSSVPDIGHAPPLRRGLMPPFNNRE